MPRPLPFTDDELREAVRLSSNLYEMCHQLNVVPGGRTYGLLRRHIARLGVDASHVSLATEGSALTNRRLWTEDELREVVQRSHSIADVLRRLGYAPSGGTHRWIKAKLTVLRIDTSHFTGQAWSAGLSNLRAVREPGPSIKYWSLAPSTAAANSDSA